MAILLNRAKAPVEPRGAFLARFWCAVHNHASRVKKKQKKNRVRLRPSLRCIARRTEEKMLIIGALITASNRSTFKLRAPPFAKRLRACASSSASRQVKVYPGRMQQGIAGIEAGHRLGLSQLHHCNVGRRAFSRPVRGVLVDWATGVHGARRQG